MLIDILHFHSACVFANSIVTMRLILKIKIFTIKDLYYFYISANRRESP